MVISIVRSGGETSNFQAKIKSPESPRGSVWVFNHIWQHWKPKFPVSIAQSILYNHSILKYIGLERFIHVNSLFLFSFLRKLWVIKFVFVSFIPLAYAYDSMATHWFVFILKTFLLLETNSQCWHLADKQSSAKTIQSEKKTLKKWA